MESCRACLYLRTLQLPPYSECADDQGNEACDDDVDYSGLRIGHFPYSVAGQDRQERASREHRHTAGSPSQRKR